MVAGHRLYLHLIYQPTTVTIEQQQLYPAQPKQKKTTAAMPKIVVVPHSAIVVRRPEKADLQPPSFCTKSLRSKLDKRGIIFSSTAEEPDTPRPSNAGIDLARRFFRRSQDDHADTSGRRDGIFPVHAENEQHELRRRRTESDLRRQARLDISRPIRSPPAPDGAIVKKYGERQAEWKQRSVELKSKQNSSPQGKRWSLRTWKIQSGRRYAPEAKLPRIHEGDSSAKNFPKSTAKRAMSFYSQRWSFRPSPEKLSVLKGRHAKFSPPVPKHSHAASTEHIPIQQNLAPPPPKKAASMSSLRPQVSFDEHLAVPHRRITQRAALDQRHIHPALRTSPTPVSGSFMHAKTALPSSGPLTAPLPRVRVIPPSTFIKPQSLESTHSSHSILPIKPPTFCEQTALVKSLNTIRVNTSSAPLDLHPLLSNHAQDYVALHLPPLPPPKPMPPGHKRRMSAAMKHAHSRATTISQIEFRFPSGANAIRLISPPGLGALACAELWGSGKYRRHKTVKRGQDPYQHRFTMLPGFELSGRESAASMGSSSSGIHGAGGASSCGCAEYDSWRAVTDGRWKSVGVGRAEDGRWVVELWEPDTDA